LRFRNAFASICRMRGTPLEVIDQLNREVNAGLASQRIQARYADLGATPLPGSPAEFGKFIAADVERWAKVVKAVGIKVQ
jgi:tripartite-type tricarboxylate transporter receptor subunit TctC